MRIERQAYNVKLYSSTAVENLIERYANKGGKIVKLKDSALLEYGLAICMGDKLKYCVIKDQYLNEWSSAYVARFYNKLPKKYAIMLNNQ